MKNLAARLATAAVAAPILLALLYLLPWYAFATLAGLAGLVGSVEISAMTHAGQRAGRIATAVLFALVFLVLTITDFGRTAQFLALAALVAVVPLSQIVTLVFPGPIDTSLLRMMSLGTAPLHLGTSLASIACLRRVGEAHGSHRGAGLVVFALLVAWFGDTGGYFAGRSIGGPKLYAVVSPNKTWAGSVGGLIGSALGAVLAHFWFLPELPLRSGLIVAVACGALGQAGDLCESLVKRSAGIKDSGAILPGHGGILDRIDALLFVALGVYMSLRAGWLTLQPPL